MITCDQLADCFAVHLLLRPRLGVCLQLVATETKQASSFLRALLTVRVLFLLRENNLMVVLFVSPWHLPANLVADAKLLNELKRMDTTFRFTDDCKTPDYSTLACSHTTTLLPRPRSGLTLLTG
jgi:hypothetical protein